MNRLEALLDRLTDARSLPLNTWRAAETANALRALEEAFHAETEPATVRRAA